MKPIDTVIVGAGVAGLAAALFLTRAGRSAVVYDGGNQTILSVDKVREYLGFDGMPPADMLAQAREEVLRYGADIRQEKVEKVLPLDNGLFEVTSPGGNVTARTVVLATGATYDLPDITGIRDAWGRDLRVCPCFDGQEVRNGKFVVFGLAKGLAHMASWVRMWSDDVTVVSHHKFNETEAERLRVLDVSIIEDEIAGLIHDGDDLTHVTTQGGKTIPCVATWVSLNMKATSDLVASLCDVDADGFAITGPRGVTSRPGVFVIGNANQQWDHLAQAAAAGTGAGPVVTMYLLEQLIAERRAGGQPAVAG